MWLTTSLSYYLTIPSHKRFKFKQVFKTIIIKPYLFLPVSQILPHPVVSLLSPGLPSRTFARTDSSELIGFSFSLTFFCSCVVR